MQLARRDQLVLQLVIDAYIHTAQPVSSHTVLAWLRAKRARTPGAACPRGLSGASVRATMAELERLGLLSQPHASAGRVPTDAGLRLYVDTLLAPRLRPWDRSRLKTASCPPEAACAYPARLGQQLVRLTGLVALVATPSFLGATLREVGLVRLGPAQVLAYFVAPSGHVQQKVVRLEEDVDAAGLLAAQNLLNALLRGRTLHEVRLALEGELEGAHRAHDAWRARAARTGQQLWPAPDWAVVVEGRATLLLQPEFADRKQLHELLGAIEEKALQLALVHEMLAQPGVRVRLGSEHAQEGLEQLAYVGCSTAEAGHPQAAIGLFGPARMDYGRLMPLVAYASKTLARFCAQL